MPQAQPDSQVLRNSLTREVTNDAYAISGQIFKGQEPDVSRVSNDQLDARYQQAINTGDRQYLMAEASRDPAQFMASMQRLIDAGQAYMPPGQELTQQPKLPQAARPDVPLPSPPPQAFPSTVTPGAPTPPTAPPATAGSLPSLPAALPVPLPPAGTGVTTG